MVLRRLKAAWGSKPVGQRARTLVSTIMWRRKRWQRPCPFHLNRILVRPEKLDNMINWRPSTHEDPLVPWQAPVVIREAACSLVGQNALRVLTCI